MPPTGTKPVPGYGTPQPGTGFAALAPLQTPVSNRRHTIREKGSSVKKIKRLGVYYLL